MSQSIDHTRVWATTKRPHRLKRRPEERVRVLGAPMDLTRREEVFHFVARRLSAGEKTIVANQNLHSVYLTQIDPCMRQFFERANLIEVDSMPLIFWARLLGMPSRKFHRCTYLDWRQDFWTLANDQKWRVFFIGGKAGVAEKAREHILTQWPLISLEVHTGYFDTRPNSNDNEALLERLHSYMPDILLVGLGMPTQERWILEHYERLPTCAVFPIGGAFDYEAGVQKKCPRILGQIGLEWAFRLYMNPRRLFHRYCIEPFYLLVPAGHDIMGRLRAKRKMRRETRRFASPLPSSQGELER